MPIVFLPIICAGAFIINWIKGNKIINPILSPKFLKKNLIELNKVIKIFFSSKNKLALYKTKQYWVIKEIGIIVIIHFDNAILSSWDNALKIFSMFWVSGNWISPYCSIQNLIIIKNIIKFIKNKRV